MMFKEQLLTELQRIMPRARWHHTKTGTDLRPALDLRPTFRALMDPSAPMTCVNSRVTLVIGVGRSPSLLEMPVVGSEYVTPQDTVENFANAVRHILMFRFAWWLAETAKRARDALGGHSLPTDPINPFAEPTTTDTTPDQAEDTQTT